jgi:hypothetical protein
MRSNRRRLGEVHDTVSDAARRPRLELNCIYGAETRTVCLADTNRLAHWPSGCARCRQLSSNAGGRDSA